MKKLTIFFLAILLGATVFAQAPQSFRYQAVARDNSGNVLASQNVSFRISILSGSVSGAVAYSETHTGISTNAFGLVELEIARGTPVAGTFSSINWDNNSYFVKIEMDPLGGSDYQELSTSQLLSVPYALHAKTAEVVSFTNGIYLPYGFFPDTSFIGSQGNFISFGHKWVSEDFIGYKKNKFYFKDTPGGDDKADPDVIVGGKIGIGVEEPNEKLEIDGNIDIHNHTLKNLSNPVNAQDAATKAYVAKILLALGLVPNNFEGIAEDIDGNVYKTVKLGTQEWMAENLKVTRYNDGTGIPIITDDAQWLGLTTGAYCWYENDAATNKNLYGALYNWYAVKTDKLCPEGWHVPSDAEWTTLENYLIANGYNYDGTTSGNKIAKSLATTTNWAASTNTGIVGNTDFPTYRNKTSFSALPGGYRYYVGYFIGIGYTGSWWSSTEGSTDYAWSRYLYYYDSHIGRGSYVKDYGFSVRCVRDF